MPQKKYQWGRMSRGQSYVILATDILRAFAALGLGVIEGEVLIYAIENTWGKTAKRGRRGEPWPDTRPCQLDLATLEKLIGFTRTNICRAITKLASSRILLKVEGGFVVNKEAHDWVKPGTEVPRLDPHLLAYAASAQRLDASIESEPDVITGDNESATAIITNDHGLVSQIITGDNDLGNQIITGDKAPSSTTGAGKPYGVNTKPYGVHSKQPRRESSAPSARSRKPPGQWMLPLSDDEPFIPPVESRPLPLAVPNEGADLIEREVREIVLLASRATFPPDGDPEKAQFLAGRARAWLLAGYEAVVIKKAIRSTVKTQRHNDTLRFERYAWSIVLDETGKLSSVPDAPAKVPPSQTRPVEYYDDSKYQPITMKPMGRPKPPKGTD